MGAYGTPDLQSPNSQPPQGAKKRIGATWIIAIVLIAIIILAGISGMGWATSFFVQLVFGAIQSAIHLHRLYGTAQRTAEFDFMIHDPHREKRFKLALHINQVVRIHFRISPVIHRKKVPLAEIIGDPDRRILRVRKVCNKRIRQSGFILALRIDLLHDAHGACRKDFPRNRQGGGSCPGQGDHRIIGVMRLSRYGTAGNRRGNFRCCVVRYVQRNAAAQCDGLVVKLRRFGYRRVAVAVDRDRFHLRAFFQQQASRMPY